MDFIGMYVEQLSERYPDLRISVPDVKRAYQILVDVFANGNKLLICGNGGSAADSEHITGELMKSYLLSRPIPQNLQKKLSDLFAEDGTYLARQLEGALPVISLVSQSSLISATTNDIAADMMFAQQVYGYGRPGDAIFGITTSGKSKNVLRALQVGRALGLSTLGLTGQGTPELQGLCDVLVCVPSNSTPEVQEYHLAIYHAICADLEEEFFGK